MELFGRYSIRCERLSASGPLNDNAGQPPTCAYPEHVPFTGFSQRSGPYQDPNRALPARQHNSASVDHLPPIHWTQTGNFYPHNPTDSYPPFFEHLNSSSSALHYPHPHCIQHPQLGYDPKALLLYQGNTYFHKPAFTSASQDFNDSFRSVETLVLSLSNSVM